MANESNSSSSGVSFFGLLTIVFITLKLLGVITWSWVWVLAPLWLGFIVVVTIVIIVLVIAAIVEAMK